MDVNIRKAQERVLQVFSEHPSDFALAGGTALELYYLNHRFSSDLDFFSPRYDISEMDQLVLSFKNKVNRKIKLISETTFNNQAKIRFYSMPVPGSNRPLKIDFIEDVFFKNPAIQDFKGVRVYSANNIYLQKIAAISGTRSKMDPAGREILEGRKEAKDVFDLYMLSKKIQPLHEFLPTLSSQWQRGMIHWYRTFSRHDLKLELLDLDIYDTHFNSRELVAALDAEIKQFAKGIIKQ